MTPDSIDFTEFWQTLPTLEFKSEAEVETRLLFPLLKSLEYRSEDIQPKFPVKFFTGRTGRSHEADLVAFSGPKRDRNTSLLVIEAKPPIDSIENAKEQAESYAQWLRAPVYLQTNGIFLEIWQLQIAWDSNCVFSSPVKQLHERRGELESILRKSALIEHCERLRLKTISFEDIDVCPYIDAIASVTGSSASALTIDRRLVNAEAATSPEISSSQLLEAFPRGCIVRAGSGVGKTVLAQQVMDRCVRGLLLGTSDKIPINLYLPDIAALGTSLIRYAMERVGVHLPPYGSEPAFKELLRRGRAVLICDAFERVPDEHRARIAADLRAFSRDFPKAQLLVLSRMAVSSELAIEALPQFDLALMNDRELSYMAEASGLTENQAHILVDRLPRFLRQQSKIPFLFNIILQDYRKAAEVPRDIVTPFRRWIDALLRYDNPPLQTLSSRMSALKLLAVATTASFLPLDAAIQRLRSEMLSDEVLGQLELSGVIQQRHGYIELIHEALGDFLRADDVASIQTDSEFESRIEAMSFNGGTAFSIFLSGLLSTLGRQRALWDVLARKNFSTYLAALHFRADLSSGLQIKDRNLFDQWFLYEILTGFDDLTRLYFEPWIDTIPPYLHRRKHAKHIQLPPDRLIVAIQGMLAPDNSTVTYNYCLVPEGEQRVMIGPVDAGTFRNLGLSRLPDDSGRLIGILDLYRRLLEAVDECKFRGGRMWSRERLISNLGKLGLPGRGRFTNMSLAELQVIFRPLIDQVEVSGVLEDIDCLLQNGDESLSAFLPPGPDRSPPPRGHLWSEVYSKQRLKELVKDQFSKIYLAYREIAETSLSPFLTSLRNYSRMPIRVRVRLLVPEGGDPFDGKPVLYEDWEPVSSWGDFSVDVELVDAPPPRVGRNRAEEIRQMLRKLGRRSDVVTSERQMLLEPPDVFCGSDKKTTVMAEVTAMVKEDIEDLFRDITGRAGW